MARLIIFVFVVVCAALVFSKQARAFAWAQLRDHGFRTTVVVLLTAIFVTVISSTNSGLTFNQ